MYKALISFCNEELDIAQGEILASDFASAEVIADLLEAGYIEEYEEATVYRYKGTVSTYNDLPDTGLSVGDVYNVESDGSNYAWTGTAWDKLGGDIDLSGYQTKIDSSHKLSSDLVDDTNNTNKFVSTSEKTTWNAKYDKPSGGIPSTDLSSAVQTSLGKADTAIQDISGKQDVLTAGNNITIQNNVISATGGANYTAGDGIDITNNVISSIMPIHLIEDNSYDNPFVIQGCEPGIYTFGRTGVIWYKLFSTQPVGVSFQLFDGALIITDNTYSSTSEDSSRKIGYVYGTRIASDNTVENFSGELIANKAFASLVVDNSSGIKSVSINQAVTISGVKTFSTLPESSVVPTTNNQFVNKKYVDDAVASAGSSVPTITITASQIVSQNPLQISMTAEQQAIIEDVNIGTLIIDGSALGVTPAYCQKNEDGSTDVLFAAFSFAWNVTSGFNISNTAIFAGHYDKQTHILTVINTPLLGNTPTADNHLANKKYVDDTVAGAGGGSNLPIYVINTTGTLYDSAGTAQVLENDAATQMQAAIRDAYTKNYKGITIILNSTTSGKTFMFYSDVLINTSSSTFTFFSNYDQSESAIDLKRISIRKLTVNGLWSEGSYSANSVVYAYAKALLLTANNTQSYTVSNNYTPAHKKYVDDSIAAAITTTLGGSF